MTSVVQVTTQATAQVANPWWSDYLKAIMVSAVSVMGTLGAAKIAKWRHPKAVQAEMSDQIASAFEKLVDQLQEENRRHLHMIEGLRKEGHALRGKLAQLQAFAHLLFKYAAGLEEQLKSLGGTLPPRPELPELDTLS